MPKGLQGFQKGNKMTYRRANGTGKSWNTGKILGDKHWNWRGDDVSYENKHTRIYRKLGQPDTCVNCGKSGLTGKKIHWANISGQYKDDANDWVRLCASCHRRFDMTDELRVKLSEIAKVVFKSRMRNLQGQFI